MTDFEIVPGAPHQDYIVLAGRTSPGKAVVRDATSPRRWNILDGYGLVGSTIVYAGSSLSKFNVDIYVWEQAHFLQWDTFASVLALPKRIRDPGALSIDHPLLNEPPISITEVVIGDVTQWEQVDDGLWCRTIPMIAYRKPVPMAVRPKEAPPGLSANVPRPVDPRAMELAQGVSQAAALGAELAK